MVCPDDHGGDNIPFGLLVVMPRMSFADRQGKGGEMDDLFD
jgi:hypothetical protein